VKEVVFKIYQKMRIMNIRKFLVLLFILSLFESMIGCKNTASLENANRAYELYQFNLAIDLYKKVTRKVKDKEKRNEIYLKMADSYRNMSEYKRAQSYYERALKDKKCDPYYNYMVGDMLMRQEEYDEAIIAFQKYVREYPGDEKGQQAIEMCEKAIKWQEEKTRYVVEQFKILNSKDNDFAPMFYKKGAMILTSDREGVTGRKEYVWTGRQHTDIFISEKGRARRGKDARLEKPVRIDEDEIVNTKFNEGVVTFDSRMTTMFYTQCNDAKGKGHNCRIFVSKKRGRSWGEPEVLPFCTDSFVKYGHPALSPNGKKLYFVSDMEGGFGGHDIYMSSFVRRGSTWSDPVNLGPTINTEGNEMYPYSYTNKRLYFSSDGLPGIGGLDIFYSEREENEWTEPINMKSPINSGGDDFGIIIEPGGTVARGYKGYLSSNRPGSRGDDIYRFYMTPLEYTLSGTVFNIKTKEIIPDATVTLTINDSTKVTVQTDETGGYKYILEPENDYSVFAYKKYFFDSKDEYCSTVGLEFSEDFIRDLYLDPFLDTTITLEGIFYDLDKWDLRPESMVILDTLYQIMTAHPYIVIEIGSHTDCRATYEYNDELSQKRAQSVVDYLTYKGIPMDRLEAKGYGERMLTNNCSCEGGEGPGRSCTEEEHQQNRRTTFRILRTDYEYGESPAPDPRENPRRRNRGDDTETQEAE
jgi:peptidoglycan-associated lipoprotein